MTSLAIALSIATEIQAHCGIHGIGSEGRVTGERVEALTAAFLPLRVGQVDCSLFPVVSPSLPQAWSAGLRSVPRHICQEGWGVPQEGCPGVCSLPLLVLKCTGCTYEFLTLSLGPAPESTRTKKSHLAAKPGLIFKRLCVTSPVLRVTVRVP